VNEVQVHDKGGKGGWNSWEEIGTNESAGSYARENAETASAEIDHSADVPSANLLREVLVGLEASKLWPGEVGVRCNNKNLFLPAIRATLAMHLRSSLFYIHTVVPHNSRFHALDAPPLPIPWVNVMAFHIAPGVTRQCNPLVFKGFKHLFFDLFAVNRKENFSLFKVLQLF